jgi:hypothetical protein
VPDSDLPPIPHLGVTLSCRAETAEEALSLLRQGNKRFVVK